jgi:hypothetical protein
MPNYGQFSSNITPERTVRELAQEFKRWGVTEWDVPIGTAPSLRTSTRSLTGTARLWFVLNGERKDLTCSRFDSFQTNLRALYLTIEALRLASQRGILEQYRQFFEALPPPSGEPLSAAARDPYEVLGVTRSAGRRSVEAVYRALAKEHHPDMAGGSETAMREINEAWECIEREWASEPAAVPA